MYFLSESRKARRTQKYTEIRILPIHYTFEKLHQYTKNPFSVLCAFSDSDKISSFLILLILKSRGMPKGIHTVDLVNPGSDNPKN
ncbi:MAG: hypothetical protein OXD54_06890 [Candidatus Poribacteria bacterium]|nr:hypothetical protein [Candidatus Poribacteria bacterium]